MKIGLIDVDSHNFPNLALMKISSYHKELGDKVEWYDNISAFNYEYDIVYMSKVFDNTYTKDYQYPIFSKKVIKGGYGYDNYKKPFKGYEKQFPDYSIYYDIYPQFKNTAFGYLTRGCPRNCSFCMVGKYEGLKTTKVSSIENFYDKSMHKEIKLLDPNIFGSKESVKFLKELADTNAIIDITQGVDIRLLNKEQAEVINTMRVKMLHFAWDNDDNGITEKMFIEKRKLIKFGNRVCRVYVLVNYNTNFEFDIYRVKKLKELDYDPYVMIYDRPNADKKYKHLQRYVNNKFIFWGNGGTLEEYLNLRR